MAILAGFGGTVPRTMPITVRMTPINPKPNPIFNGVLNLAIC
jgi:hypothetical protein